MPEPSYPNNIGKVRIITAIDGRRRQYTIDDEIVRRQQDSRNPKLIYLQRLRFADEGKTEYRFTYYMLGRMPKVRGRWVFGQYSLFIPPHDLAALLREARSRGWEGI